MVLPPAEALGRCRALRLALLLLLTSPLPAQALAPPLSEFAHSAWTVNEGAPADVWTLARAPAGYLWLGTGLGLYRFDGVRFDRYPLREGQRLPGTNINALLALPDGDVWIGLYTGGTVRLSEGMVTSFGEREGMPAGRVLRLARGSDGALWAAAQYGLARFDGQRWQRISSDWQYPEAGADYVFTDSRGVLWVAGLNQLYHLRPGEQRLRATGETISRGAVLAEDLGGRIWITDRLRGTRPLPDYAGGAALASAAPAPAPAIQQADHFSAAKQLLFASDGSLWLTQLGVGLLRLRDPAAIARGHSIEARDGLERFSREDGLPSEVPVPLVQTSEGDVWVGTNRGLASLRLQRLQSVPALANAPHKGFVLATLGEGVLAANSEVALALDPPRTPQSITARPGSGQRLYFAIRGPDGTLWQNDALGAWREREGRRERIALGDGRNNYGVRAMAADATGGAWLSVTGGGVFHVGAAGVRREPRVESGAEPPTVIAVGPGGETWFGYRDEIIVLAGEQVRRYGIADGLLAGQATAIHAGRHAVFVAGESGFARFDGQRFASLSAERDDAFAHVTGVIETTEGDLWLNGGRGVVQVKAADVDAMFSQIPARLNYRLFNWRDGLPGIAVQASAVPTIVQDERARLWFMTNSGVAWLDPRRVARNEQPPGVEIQSLRVGDRSHRPVPGLSLPPGTRNIVIRYTALTLAAAERARFRYRLEGVDSDWQDADTRREASYANLGDGDYAFRVIAANGDGVWNTQGTELRFSIAPTMVQSRPFALACALTLLLLVWAAYSLRTRAIAARVRLRLEERHSERERIARELHDTLLQSTQGLIVNVQGLASALPAQEPVRSKIEQLLDRADEVVLEARERVRDLRSKAVAGGQLIAALQRTGRELGEDCDRRGDKGAVIFRVVSSGTERDLNRSVCDEVYSLAREALLNAFRHGRPQQVEVELAYGASELSLRIRDDGIGIAPSIVEGGSRPGHWGLAGMRERAKRLGGRLGINSRPGAGTEVELRLPASICYAQPATPRTDRSRLSRWLAAWRSSRNTP